MKILLLRGQESDPKGMTATYLREHGHDVVNPSVDDDDFNAALRTAQADFDRHRPDVIVGYSRAGALAMNLESAETPLVLLSPEWKKYGTAKSTKSSTIIIHWRGDDDVPFAESEELVESSRLPAAALIEAGNDHRLADPETLRAILGSAEEAVRQSAIVGAMANMREACQGDSKSVLPVYGIQGDKPVQDRTGVLLGIAGQGFMITAAHDLKAITDNGIPLFVTSPRPGQGGIQLVGELHATEEAVLDVAVVKLNASTKSMLDDAGATFLRCTDVDQRATVAPALYFVRGYPHECNASPMTLTTVLYQGEQPPANDDFPFDPSSHLLLDHNRYLRRGRGEEFRSPRISGMSGGGIWRLTTKPPPFTGWTPDERRLVAIQTKCGHGRFLKGTWIKHAFGLIFDRCPDLRKVMSSSLFIPR